MANLMSDSLERTQYKLLASKFVFYKQLEGYGEGTVQRSLYDTAIANGEAAFSINKPESRAAFIASQLRAMSKNEAMKDIKLLNTYFGGNYNIDDMYNKDIGKQITIALNEALNLKDIFRRNCERIINEKGDKRAVKVTISSVMESYMLTALRNSWTTILNHIMNRLANSNGNYSIEKAIEDEFNSKYIEEVIERALDKALSSPTWTGGTDNPFKELADYLNTHSESKNYIIKKMYDYLGITELKNNMIENIKNSGQLKGFRGNKKINLTTSIKSGAKKNQGLMGEVMSQVITEAALNLHSDNVKFTAEQVGGVGAKPDVLFGIELKVKTPQNIMENKRFKDKSRETNRRRAIDINEHLKRLDKGILIYSNVKDWSLTEGFKQKGFSTGNSMKLDTYANVMKKTKTNDFIGAIANAMKDAVFGDEKHRQAILEMITQDMANFLFDDVYTVGKKMANKGATLIHLMNLDGIYIPMSYLLLLLAEAFEEGNKRNYRDIFYPTIKYPSILYPTGGEGHKDEKVWTYEDWKRQREDALDKIVISAHFARSLDEIVKELVGK